MSATLETAESSDYGSDLDADTWDDLFSQSPTVLPSLEEPVLPRDDAEHVPTRSLRLARIRENIDRAITGLDDTSRELERDGGWRAARTQQQQVEVECDEGNRGSFSGIRPPPEKEKSERPPSVPEQPSPPRRSAEPESMTTSDTRSPLERFRTKPKKPLSVTDIVSPAWCELQYWYSLTRYGRVKKTPAMKAGSKIHKEKEREVHVEVPVEITTKEDRLGLRLWNIIGGLRTLRATGLTRELEVIGLVDGQVMVGVIDEISYTCPDEALEEKILEAADLGRGGKRKKKDAIPADQTTMSDFFGGDAQSKTLDVEHGRLRSRRPANIYLTDIKTRGSKSMPKLEGQMRATRMQLMLYRRLLNDLAANNVDAEPVFERYNVDPHGRFSDSFIAQLADLNTPASTQPPQHEEDDENDEPLCANPQPEQDALDEVLQHQTCSSLWALMISEFSKTISVNAISSSISPLLTAEFRKSDTGVLIGRQSFAYDAEVLEGYVQEEMRWWKGERQAKGVDVEESYKCKMCEFAEKCEWRIEKDREAGRKARVRRAAADSEKTT
ncbi:Exonuclease V, chloroplastic [Lecanosticta acicola]|uniref:Exonuclease V, chloroplastic n=1 Tax=Lecanosticta acicola TaxID=111012 RepID=A0AAI8YZN9_9PEZI|nr:Exonuclease V, chloroplastic [Lecanosticta acicola]